MSDRRPGEPATRVRIQDGAVRVQVQASAPDEWVEAATVRMDELRSGVVFARFPLDDGRDGWLVVGVVLGEAECTFVDCQFVGAPPAGPARATGDGA